MKSFAIQKKWSKCFFILGITAIFSVLGFTGQYIASNIGSVNATEETELASDLEPEGEEQPGELLEAPANENPEEDPEEEPKEEPKEELEESPAEEEPKDEPGEEEQSEEEPKLDVTFDFSNDGITKTYLDSLQHYSQPVSASPLRRQVRGTYPSSYNSHNTYSTYTRTKNQNSEGICWAYAASTSLEYLLQAKYQANSVSPKHFDYQLVPASSAYTDSGVANAYYNRWVSIDPALARGFGDGGNEYLLLLGLSNPKALMSESQFTSVIKANDSRLSSISKYEDIWNLSNKNSILSGNTDEATYAVKQKYNQINDQSASNYIVTGAKRIYYPIYGSSTEKNVIVEGLKAAIQAYGAVWISTYFDTDRCMDYSYDSNVDNIYFTIIDRSNENSSICTGGHAVTIIGWDDNWSYKDNGVTKQGAFIVQNSYGEKVKVGDYNPNAHFYMSYDSAFKAMYFDSLTATNKFNIYSLENYRTPTISAGNDEYVFEFTSAAKEKHSKITFDQIFYAAENYDVYVSTTGNASNFSKVGSLTAFMGRTEYSFSSPIEVNGKFAIKLKRKNSTHDNLDEEKALNVLNAFTVNADGSTPSDDPSGDTEPSGQITWIQGQNYVQGEGENLVLRVDYAANLLTSVSLDGELLDKEFYDVESGSTILTIHDDFLDTLELGEHTLALAYSNGDTVYASFTILEESLVVPSTSSPDTGTNTKTNETGKVFTIATPVVIMTITLASYLTHRNKKHVDFESKKF